MSSHFDSTVGVMVKHITVDPRDDGFNSLASLI